jgi:hypothetical protein
LQKHAGLTVKWDKNADGSHYSERKFVFGGQIRGFDWLRKKRLNLRQ